MSIGCLGCAALNFVAASVAQLADTTKRRWMILLWAFSPAFIAIASGQTLPKLLSPRLSNLQEDVTKGKADAGHLFWTEIADHAPLVEAVPNSPKEAWVTFLWRDGGTTKDVVVVARLNGIAPFQDGQSHMIQLKGTDVWYRTYRLPVESRFTYFFSVNSQEAVAAQDVRRVRATYQPDPLNSRRYTEPSEDGRLDPNAQIRSVAILSEPAGENPAIAQPGRPAGEITLERMRSETLKNERRIWIYTPPGFRRRSQPYPLLILLDGWSYLKRVPSTTILDNLLAQHRIPPCLAVLVDNAEGAARDRELHYDEDFVKFLSTELLPKIRERYGAGTSPGQTIIGGSSAGGLTAAFVALRRPDLFGKVLSQSGAFWWWRDGLDTEAVWLAREFAARPLAAIQFSLTAGLFEDAPSPRSAPNLLTANRHIRDVLRAKGYTVDYREVPGGHEPLSWTATFAESLQQLLAEPRRAN
jgi:enterochelin esterase-like enzyme